jgi:hypothetical protein
MTLDPLVHPVITASSHVLSYDNSIIARAFLITTREYPKRI